MNVTASLTPEQARTVLKSGKLIAYPTEAVWGLGCDPFNAQALQDLIALKGRDSRKGLILVAATLDAVLPYLATLTPEQLTQLRQNWPGFVTYLLPLAQPSAFPVWLTGAHNKIAVRVSAHPTIQAICGPTGLLVSTSANPAGAPPARSAPDVTAYFDQQVQLVTGEIGQALKPSPIIDLLTGEIIRAG